MVMEYAFYTEEYGGKSISEADWNRLSMKAYQRLQKFTFGRLSDKWTGEPWERQAKNAICEMAEALHLEEKRGGKTSENTDGYSVAYAAPSDEAGLSLYDIAYVYLGNTGMMDWGVDEG